VHNNNLGPETPRPNCKLFNYLNRSMCNLSPRYDRDVPVITDVLNRIYEGCYGVYIRGVDVVRDGYGLMSQDTRPPCKFRWQELTVTQEAVGVKINSLSDGRSSLKIIIFMLQYTTEQLEYVKGSI